MPPKTAIITGRCYCGACSVSAFEKPLIVAYCHCNDCRRLSGAPVSGLVAFARDALEFSGAKVAPKSFKAGVDRWSCPDCGTQLAATYDYLPDQIYVPLGLLDQADQMPPAQHSHAGSALPWLHIKDDIPRFDASGRDGLNAATKAQ